MWRNPDGSIDRKVKTRTCRISPHDIERMNKQMYGASITEGGGGAEFYFEAIPEETEVTRADLLKQAEEQGIDIDKRARKSTIIEELTKNKEQC